jgi:phage baseplate assembly protein W
VADGFYKGIALPTSDNQFPNYKFDKELIRDSVKTILLTKLGQRYFVPDFGSRLWSLVFEPNDTVTSALAEEYARSALREWEKRIDVMQVITNRDEHQLTVTVVYRIRRVEEVDFVRLDLSRDRIITQGAGV